MTTEKRKFRQILSILVVIAGVYLAAGCDKKKHRGGGCCVVIDPPCLNTLTKQDPKPTASPGIPPEANTQAAYEQLPSICCVKDQQGNLVLRADGPVEAGCPDMVPGNAATEGALIAGAEASIAATEAIRSAQKLESGSVAVRAGNVGSSALPATSFATSDDSGGFSGGSGVDNSGARPRTQVPGKPNPNSAASGNGNTRAGGTSGTGNSSSGGALGGSGFSASGGNSGQASGNLSAANSGSGTGSSDQDKNSAEFYASGGAAGSGTSGYGSGDSGSIGGAEGHQIADYGARGLGANGEDSVPAMSGEDPEDYFTRIDLKDDLFQQVGKKYRQQAVRWAAEPRR